MKEEVGVDSFDANTNLIALGLAERVSKHKQLTGGVHFIDAIPKNPSGKILRKELREKAALESTKAKL